MSRLEKRVLHTLHNYVKGDVMFRCMCAHVRYILAIPCIDVRE